MGCIYMQECITEKEKTMIVSLQWKHGCSSSSVILFSKEFRL